MLAALTVAVHEVKRKLGALLKQEYALLYGLHDDVRFLKTELEITLDVIHHCGFLDEKDALFWHWIDLFREQAYAVEDWVDLLTVRVDAATGGNPSFSFRSQGWLIRSIARRRATIPTRRVISSELQELKKGFTEIAERRERYKQVDVDPPFTLTHRPRVDPRLSVLNEDIGRLVGLARPMEEVTKMVTESGGKAEPKTVFIVGMAGSGKTTLANAVYMRLREEKCFQCHAFVSVGLLDAHREKILMDMLSMLDNVHHQLDRDDIDGLFDRIRHILQNKRYLVVVDDLQSENLWEFIRHCFPYNSLGSRIITTTRNAALVRGSDCIYSMKLLSEMDSRKLILNTAFGTEHDCSQDLEDHFPQITRRCGGLPLALVTLSSILRDTSKDEWNRLIGSGCFSISHPGGEDIKWIFDRICYVLPPRLETCLLYLSIFPENYEIDTARLMRLWIAEGFMADVNNMEEEEETARRYLTELISRNIVQPLHLIHDGTPRYCRLHPVIHDFIVHKSKEQNFVTLMEQDDQGPDVSNNNRTAYRLSITSSSKDQDHLARNGFISLSRVRSIIVFGRASAAPPLTNLSLVRVLDLTGCDGPVCLDGLGNLPLLRYLSLEGTDVSELPAETFDNIPLLRYLSLGGTDVSELPAAIFNSLPLLRYLSLRGTDVTELPATIWELKRLETLDVRSTKVKELPRSIVRLKNTLRTLLYGCEGLISSTETATRIAEDIQHCGMLEDLATVDLRGHHANFVKGIGGLYRLRVITIIWSSQQCTEEAYRKALLSSIEKWRNLESLTIHCGLGCSMEFLSSLSHPPKQLEKFKVTAGSFVSVPNWIQWLKSLYFVQINVCRLVTDDLNILRDLPNLQFLILGLDFVPRETILIETEGFRNLWGFSVNCPVPWLTFETGAMPNLTHLQVELCSGSATKESVPYGIGNLQRLTDVALLYNQEWCGNSSSVTRTVDAVKRQVAKHRNLINLTINNTKVDVVKEVDEEAESATEIQSGINVPVQQVCEEMVRTTVGTPVETCDEIVEVDGDNINDA